MKANATQSAKIEQIENGWRLGIQRGDASGYRDAQLDDYSHLRRYEFPRHSLTLSLRARASSSSIPGTWGFGLWNDPFGLALGFGGHPFRLPALPNAVWFFHASQENYLSFKNGLGAPPAAANGFLAQTFRSPRFHPLLILAGLALPFSRRTTRRLMGKVIDEDGIKLDVDVTQWHAYKFEWSPQRVTWDVDDVRVFESPVSPNPPLGLIIWIDNQYAAFTPEGRLAAGVLKNEDSWIEVEDIVMRDA